MQHLINATVMLAALKDWKVTRRTNDGQTNPNLKIQRKQEDGDHMCLVQIQRECHSAVLWWSLPSQKGLRG